MKTQKLNYEFKSSESEPFQFHADTVALARDHVEHYMGCQNIKRAFFRKIGAEEWRQVKVGD